MDQLRVIRREISNIDPNVTSFHAHSMVQQIGETLFPVRVSTSIYVFIAICGLILASVGYVYLL